MGTPIYKINASFSKINQRNNQMLRQGCSGSTRENCCGKLSTRLNMTIQLGPKSLQEIEELLQKSGFIGNPDTWPGN
jgi:hypothetical protein